MIMYPFRSLSIKSKLTLVMLLTIVAGVTLIGAFFMMYERSHIRAHLGHEIEVMAKVANSQIQAALVFDDLITLQEIANSLDFDETIDVVCLYDAEFRLRARSFPGDSLLTSCPDFPHSINSGFAGEIFHHVEDVYSEGARIGTIFIEANTLRVNKQMQGYVTMTLTALAIITAFSLVVALRLQKTVTSPRSDLAATASEVAVNRDYSVRALKQSSDEIGQMVDVFNGMLEAIEIRDNELSLHKSELETKVEERTSELQAANKELEAFSYSVSHDLRSPLRAIDGFSQALLEDYSDSLDETGRSYLERLRQASQRMGSLIDSLLRLSRVTRQEISLGTSDLSAMCEEIVNELIERDAQRDIRIVIQPNMHAKCDARLMRIVLSNLIENAWKYTYKTQSPSIHIGFENGVFFVKDNGAGFDMRYADKLFGAFQRLHSKDDFDGTGIGLATVSRIIQRHGGDIWAEAEVSRGATFNFVLPS